VSPSRPLGSSQAHACGRPVGGFCRDNRAGRLSDPQQPLSASLMSCASIPPGSGKSYKREQPRGGFDRCGRTARHWPALLGGRSRLSPPHPRYVMATRFRHAGPAEAVRAIRVRVSLLRRNKPARMRLRRLSKPAVHVPSRAESRRSNSFAAPATLKAPPLSARGRRGKSRCGHCRQKIPANRFAHQPSTPAKGRRRMSCFTPFRHGKTKHSVPSGSSS